MSPIHPSTDPGHWTSTGEVGRSRHFVRFFDSDEDRVNSAARYLLGGIESGCCCVAVATTERLVAIEGHLLDVGTDLFGFVSRRQLLLYDVEDVLQQILLADTIDVSAFDRVFGETLAAATLRYPYVLAYGELVDVLAARGKVRAAIELERLWNLHIAAHEMRIFCAYSTANVLDVASRNEISREHTACVW
jgi:MEDS: MEthanogen/methylotroph, DcmR Sensory domain